ncbi:MAG: DEAD/DEAH box helicase [Anaerolineae bacterium]|nr:DEAD/DEAH box helicase [Anaerolineae bacterium]
MNLSDLLDQLRLDDAFTANVTAWERLPAKPARYAEFPPELDRRLVELVRRLDMAPLYSHQAQAIEAALAGQNVVLVTGTASGKSLAYHLPAIQSLLHDPSSTALYLFPTKALTQDQAAALGSLIEALDPDTPIPVSVYDGDTPQSHRSRIRQSGGVILSNPDMLHTGILPYHTRWANFFANLRLVVLDEVHTYRGIFGSHMANVLRRLRRICRFHGSDPIFICTSATIANPDELAGRLIEAPVTLVDDDGAPQGEKHIILYNPPMIDEKLGLRRSYTLETRRVAGRFLASDTQTIVFARARLTTEVLLGYVRDEVEQRGGSPEAVRGYRGGYLPLERRAIEQGLRSNSVRGVVATNALELGVDIGALGAAVLAGYPGTIASTWQQFGRAGRRADVSAGVMIASAAPLDQYVITHPRYLFERPPEHALINPDNLVILVGHLRCAAYELPFEDGEPFGEFDEAAVILDMLAEGGEVHHSGGMYRWVDDTYPAADLSLRTSGPDVIVIQDHSSGDPEVIGEIDRESAPVLVYEGAVYLHEGKQYLIEELDWEQGLAIARQAEVDYYTQSSTSTAVDVEEESESALAGDCVKAHGRVLVTSRASSYRIVRRYTHETLGFGRIGLPEQSFETTAYWFYLTPDLTAQLEDADILQKPNDYGPNWQKQRDAARARDGYRCTQCSAPERSDRQHDVHHLRPFREFGYVPGLNENYREANRLENLVTLCSTCHHIVEAGRRQRSALGGLGSVLHHVATLHLMCAPSDIGMVVEHRSKATKAPTLTIYDYAPGGLGLSVRLYDLHEEILQGAKELIEDCPCSMGCPACVGPVGEVESDTKQLTLLLLEAMTGSPPELDTSIF